MPTPSGTRVALVEADSLAALLVFGRDGFAPPTDEVYRRGLAHEIAEAARTSLREGGFVPVPQGGELLLLGLDAERPELRGLALLFHAPEGTLAPGFKRMFFRQSLLVASVLTLGFFSLWVGSQAELIAPLERLVGAMVRFRGGELSARSGIQCGSAELSELGRTFDDMAERIGAQHRPLLERSDEMARLNRLYAVLSRVNSAIVRSDDPRALTGEVLDARWRVRRADRRVQLVSRLPLELRPVRRLRYPPGLAISRRAAVLRAHFGAAGRR